MLSRSQPMSLEEAAALAARAVTPAPARWVPLGAAVHQILAQDLTAPFPIPGEARSRMDGYAVRARDTRGAFRATPRVLRCLDQTLSAGIMPSLRLEPGSACRILTGAVLPYGADAVVPDEDAQRTGDEVRVSAKVSPGQWVSAIREQMKQRTVRVRAGTRLTPSRLAAAAAMGYAHVPVRTRCRVALLSTGNEIIEPGRTWRPGTSYADTRYLLAGLVRAAQATPIHLGCAPDDPSTIAAMLDQAPGHTVVTTGGTGRGDKDFVFRIWKDLGIVPIFQGVAMKPGGGAALGHRKGRVFWAVPGSPWAAAVVFHELFVPMLETWYGAREPLRPTYTARLKRGITWKQRGVRIVPGKLFVQEETLWFDPIRTGTSNSLLDFAESNAYAVIPSGCVPIEPDTRITAKLLLGKEIVSQ